MGSSLEKLVNLVQEKNLVLFGATTSARDLLENELAETNIPVKYLCDMDLNKQGKNWDSPHDHLMIYKPEKLLNEDKENIAVLITTLFDEVAEKYLQNLGIKYYMSARNILNERINIQSYWNERYEKGYDTGEQTQGYLMNKQIEFVNQIIDQNNLESVFELGCGNGKILEYLHLKNYVGCDISEKAIELCRKKYHDDYSKKFFLSTEPFINSKFDLSLSLGNVIPSIVEESVFKEYIQNLFHFSKKFVCIFSSNIETKRYGHIRSWKFTDYVKKNINNWELIEIKKTNYSYKTGDPLDAQFYVYQYIN